MMLIGEQMGVLCHPIQTLRRVHALVGSLENLGLPAKLTHIAAAALQNLIGALICEVLVQPGVTEEELSQNHVKGEVQLWGVALDKLGVLLCIVEHILQVCLVLVAVVVVVVVVVIVMEAVASNSSSRSGGSSSS